MAIPKLCLDLGPARWSSAQRRGDDLAPAIDRTFALARAADAAGLDSLWAMEDPEGWDAFAVLGAIARETETIRLGTGVINPYYRHPAQLAAAFATLDLMSNGRAFVGLGRGQVEWYERSLGMTVDSPPQRLIETMDLLRQWWSPNMTATSPESATQFRVSGWERELRPTDGPLPIYLAAVGPIAMRVAAEHADGVIFNDLSSFDFMRDQVAKVKRIAANAGRDPESLTFAARSQAVITDDPEAEYERRKATVAMIHTLPGMERLLQTDGMDTESLIADIRGLMHTEEILAHGGAFPEMRRRGDLAAAKTRIPNDLMAELVVAGSVTTVRAKLEELHRIGITHVFLAQPKNPNDLSGIVTSLRSA